MATIAQKKAALYDIWAFADLINFKGGRTAFADFHVEYAAFLCSANEPGLDALGFSKSARRLCMMPRGHLKSTLGSILYVLWRVYRNPDIRVLYSTSSQKLGRAFIRELRQYWEDADLQKEVWNARPHIKGNLIPALDAAGRRAKSQKHGSSRFVTDDDDADVENLATDKKLIWSRDALQVIRPGKFKEPTVWMVSTGTMSTGDHADLLILDDVVTFKNSDTPEKRDDIFEWSLDLASIVDPPRNVRHDTFHEWVGSEWVILGTRYFGGDLYETMMEQGERLKLNTYIRNIYKNGVDDSDGYLWQEKFTPEYVADLRAQTEMDKGKNRWASQYLNLVITEEDKLVKENSIQYVHAAHIEVQDGTGMVKITLGEERVYVRLQVVVDPAASVSAKSDFSVIAVGGYDDRKRLFVVDLKAGKWDGVELVTKIFDTCDRWKAKRVHVEAVAYQRQLLTFIRDRFPIRGALALLEYLPKGKKQERITAQLEPLLQNQMLYAANWVAAVPEFQDEIKYFPKSKHDDVLDAIAILAEVSTKTSSQKKAGVVNGRQQRTYNKMFGGVR
jgi:predicted phage terminase large subunit-like protein